YSCVLMDDIELLSNYRYRYKTQGILNEGTWSLEGDTLILISDYQKKNLLRKEELLFDKSDSLLLGETTFNQLNDMFLESIKPMKFVRKNKLFIQVSKSKNVNNNCYLKKTNK
ncbi:MAG: hypothetical protein WBI53_11670, partial [Paludibacter sp.]